MSTTKKRNYPGLIACLLLLAGFGLLAFLALGSGLGSGLGSIQVRCLGVAEALKPPDSPELIQPELIQVVGTVDNLQSDNQNLFATSDGSGQTFSFTLLDRQNKNKQITVVSNTLPASLREGGDVFVTGRLNRANQTLSSTEIITKCPTKYQNKNAP